VYYPWHPRYGDEFEVRGTWHIENEIFYSCVLSDTSSYMIPAWMVDEFYCSRIELAEKAYCAVEILLELKRLLQSNLLSKSSKNDISCENNSEGDINDEKTDTSGAINN
jgi:hypothetical protein